MCEIIVFMLIMAAMQFLIFLKLWKIERFQEELMLEIIRRSGVKNE